MLEMFEHLRNAVESAYFLQASTGFLWQTMDFLYGFMFFRQYSMDINKEHKEGKGLDSLSILFDPFARISLKKKANTSRRSRQKKEIKNIIDI